MKKPTDTEMLDWLARNWDEPTMRVWMIWTATVNGDPYKLREAVDAAMKAERRGKK